MQADKTLSQKTGKNKVPRDVLPEQSGAGLHLLRHGQGSSRDEVTFPRFWHAWVYIVVCRSPSEWKKS